LKSKSDTQLLISFLWLFFLKLFLAAKKLVELGDSSPADFITSLRVTTVSQYPTAFLLLEAEMGD